MSDARSVLVVDRDLPYVRSRLGGAWQQARGGLVEGEVPSDAYARFVEQGRSTPGAWRAGLMPHQDMRAAFAAPPRPARVRGNPMDYHGQGRPLKAARRLAARDRAGGEGEGVLIGIVDTGMRSHPWLDGGYLASPSDFEPFDEVPVAPAEQDQAGHGTFVAGLILQQAPAAGVWVERGLDGSGVGKARAVADACRRLVDRGVAVLNLSLGCFADEPGALPVMERMVEDVRASNPLVVIVASAGNLGGPDGQDERGVFWPAALPGVVAVGAVEQGADGQPEPAKWSNWGPWVDLAAPGADLLSTYLYDLAAWDPETAGVQRDGDEAFRGWARWSGTSFSAAIVSGSIARLMTDMGHSAAGAVQELREGAVRTRGSDEAPPVAVVEPADWSEHLYEREGRPASAAGTQATA